MLVSMAVNSAIPEASGTAMAPGPAADCAAAASATASAPRKYEAPAKMRASMTPQMANCTNPTRATPIILPIISWKGLTLETIISTMRLVFSSVTPCITMPPYDMTNM